MSDNVPPPHTIFAVSDARGNTCELVVMAALAQFPAAEGQIVRRGGVTSTDLIDAVVQEARSQEGVIFYTLVNSAARQHMRASARDAQVPAVDILGPACNALHDVFRKAPKDIPGLLYASNPERFDMMEAIEFTLTHDDGRRPRDLPKAHVVLTGVSRSGKSSTSYYLAYHGVKTANVPLVPEVPPPAQLLELDPKRVALLRVNRLRLRSVREARAGTMGVVPGGYVEERAIAKENRYALGLAERHGWHIIDASYRAIEEVAKEVIKICEISAHRPRL